MNLRVSCENDSAVLALTSPLPFPRPPKKKIHNPPKTSPHQDFSSPGHCPRDRSHEQPPSTNQLRGPHRRFVSGTNNRARVTDIKNTSLQALLPLHGHSVRDVSPNQRNRDVFPHNGPELFAHPPRSGGQPTHPVPLPCPGSKRSTRRQNPQKPFMTYDKVSGQIVTQLIQREFCQGVKLRGCVTGCSAKKLEEPITIGTFTELLLHGWKK